MGKFRMFRAENSHDAFLLNWFVHAPGSALGNGGGLAARGPGVFQRWQAPQAIARRSTCPGGRRNREGIPRRDDAALNAGVPRNAGRPIPKGLNAWIDAGNSTTPRH